MRIKLVCLSLALVACGPSVATVGETSGTTDDATSTGMSAAETSGTSAAETSGTSAAETSGTSAASTTSVGSSGGETNEGSGDTSSTNCGDGVVGPLEVCFAPPVVIADDARMLALGDLDGDGVLDIVTVGENLQRLQGDGKGGFTALEPTEYNSPSSLVVSDLDDDGRDDVITVSFASGAEIRWSEADGSLSEPLSVAVPGTVGWAGAETVDGDGIADLLVITGDPSEIHVFRGLGGRAFDAATVEVVEAHGNNASFPVDVEVGDVDGDGANELLVAWFVGFGQALGVHGDLGSTEGTYEQLEIEGPPIVSQIADVDGDGIVDLLVPFGASGMEGVRVGGVARLAGVDLSPLPTTAQETLPVSPGSGPNVGAADLDEDGVDDLIVLQAEPESLAVLHGWDAVGPAATTTIDVGGKPSGFVVHDFDQDGHQDIAAAVDQQLVLVLGEP